MNTQEAKPASISNIAFETGMLWERTQILKMLMAAMEEQVPLMQQWSEAAKHRYDALEKIADAIQIRPMEVTDRP